MVQYTTEYEDKAFEQDPVPSHIEESENHLQVKLSRHGLPLVPQPSDDPFDPLNWSTSQKLTILAIICVWSFMGTLNIINVAPAFFAISEDLNCSLSAATYLVGAPLLAYGMGSLIWVALGNRFGVRTMFVLASFVGGVFSIWGALSSNYASLVAARTLASLFMAAPETLGPQAIADVFFLGDRAKCMALFTLFETSGFSVGSLIGAFITANLGWRWVEWVQAILTLSTCALIAILLPETQYTRRSANAHHRKRRLVDNFRFWPVSGGGEKKVENLWRAFIYPFRYILHPAVIIMTIHFSVLLLTANYMLTSNTFIYETEYGFDIKQTGLTGFAPFVGTLIAIPYSGLINDWYIERLRQRKDFQPEMRLPFFLLTAIITPVGCIIIGVCAQQQTLWVVPLVGEAFVMFSFLVACNLTQTYLMDVYIARADAALVIQNGFKNIAAFGISYAIVPWNNASGYAIPFGVLAVIVFLAHVPVFVLWKKGPEIRGWSGKMWEAARPSQHGDSF